MAAKSRFVTKLSTGFEKYLKSQFSEHYKRIVVKRSNAKWALLMFPLGFTVALALFPLIIGLALTFLYGMEHPRISEFLDPSDAPFVLTIVWSVTGGLGFVGMLIGIFSGLAKASQMIFDAEREQMMARQTYLLEKILRHQKNKSALRKGASTGSFFGEPHSGNGGNFGAQGNKNGSNQTGGRGNGTHGNGGRVAASAFEKLDEVDLSR